jgi:hypothetical protein
MTPRANLAILYGCVFISRASTDVYESINFMARLQTFLTVNPYSRITTSPGSRRAEAIHPDHVALVADILAPALSRAGFNGEARRPMAEGPTRGIFAAGRRTIPNSAWKRSEP